MGISMSGKVLLTNISVCVCVRVCERERAEAGDRTGVRLHQSSVLTEAHD